MISQKFVFSKIFTDETPVQQPKQDAENKANEARKRLEEARKREVAEAEKRGHEAGLEEGRRVGIEEGRREAMAGLEQETAALARQIAATMPALQSDMCSQIEAIEREAGGFVAEVFSKLVPDLDALVGLRRLERILTEALSGALQMPRVIVHVSAEKLEPLASSLETIRFEAGFPGEIEIKADPRMVNGDMRVSWGQGGITVPASTVAERILAVCHENLTDRSGS